MCGPLYPHTCRNVAAVAEMRAVTVLDGHNPNRNQGRWLAVQFARLAVMALTLGLVAVPVTCVDAHGPHSLYAPPDVQAPVATVTLSTIPGHPQYHHQHHHALDEASASTADATWIAPSSTAETSRPVINTVDFAPLASGELTATAPEVPSDRQLQSIRLLIAEPLPASSLVFDLLETPPPR